MSVNILLNNNKTDEVKKSLMIFLNKLEKERKSALYVKKYMLRYNELGRSAVRAVMLDIGIKALTDIQFESIDDFPSIKKLRKAELFFEKAYLLKDFKFPDYKLQIGPIFLTYADIEIQLDSLHKKTLDLLHRGCRQASSKAILLVTNLRELNKCHFIEKGIKYNSYRSIALELISDAQPILDHPIYKKILVNLASLLLLGIPCIANKAVNGHFFFFQKSNSVKQLDTISQTLAAAKRLSA